MIKTLLVKIKKGGRITCILMLLLLVAGKGTAQLIYWNPSSISGSFGPTPWAPAFINASLTMNDGGLIRGATVNTGGTPPSGCWGGGNSSTSAVFWSTTGGVDAEAFTFSFTVGAGVSVNLSSITGHTRRSSTGPSGNNVEYSINGGAYVLVGAWTTTATSGTTGTAQSTSLTGQAALQNIPAGTVVKFRLAPTGSVRGNYYVTGGTGSLVLNGIINTACSVSAPTSGNPAAVCAGSAVTVTGSGSTGSGTIGYTFWNATSGGTQYSTSYHPNGETVSGNSLTVPATVAGGSYTYYIQANSSAGCVSASRKAVTVTINGAPSFSGSPSATAAIYCIGNPATALSVTAASGSGSIARYDWYSNTSASTSGGTLVATHTSSATTDSYTPSTSAAGTLYYYCIVANSNTCNSTSAVSGAITVNTSNTWTGTTSVHWNVASNWTCGVPSFNTDVIIPDVTNKPLLDSNVTIRSIALNTGATLTLNGHTFMVNGAASGTGTYSCAAADNMILGSASTGTLYFTTGINTLGTLTLKDGAAITLGSALNIASAGMLTVGTTTGATLMANNNLTLVSDNEGSARVASIPVNGSGVSLSTIGGNVNVQCYVHSTHSSVPGARRAWRLLTAPVSNKSASPASTIYSSWQNGGVFEAGKGTMITVPPSQIASSPGLDAGINSNYSMYGWNVASQQLTPVANTMTGISDNNGNGDNKGYLIFVRGDRTPATINDPSVAYLDNTTLNASGVLQLGSQTFSGLATTSNGLSVIGNPYASPVDFSKVAGDAGGGTPSGSGLSNLINRMYVWNASLTGSQGVGGYLCIDDAAYTGIYEKSLDSITGINGGQATAADLSLQSGQAVFVQTAANGPASITFRESDKTSVNNYIYRPAEQPAVEVAPAESFRSTLSLLNTDSSTLLTDGLLAQFSDHYCHCVDEIDAPKLTNTDESYSLSRTGKKLSIERKPLDEVDTLFLTLDKLNQRSYQLAFALNIAARPGTGVHLEDSYTGVHLPLNMHGVSRYSFNVDGNMASKTASRFMVVFGAPSVQATLSLRATQQENTALVQWLVSPEQQISTYVIERSTDGIQYIPVYTVQAQNAGAWYSWTDSMPAEGINYYRVLSTDIYSEQQYSDPASVTINKTVDEVEAPGIFIYPNPTQGNTVGLALRAAQPGTYYYRLLDVLGRQLQEGTFTCAGGDATIQLGLKEVLARGTYQLELLQPDGTVYTLRMLYH